MGSQPLRCLQRRSVAIACIYKREALTGAGVSCERTYILSRA